MKLFGLNITRQTGQAIVAKDTIIAGSAGASGFLSTIRESFAGAWQRNVEVQPTQSLMAFSALFSCVTGISSDIAKLPPRLMKQKGLVYTDITRGSDIERVLEKPNHYQNRITFFGSWLASKLMYGNAFILKRIEGGRLTAMYVLDPRKVRILVGPTGDVFYELTGFDMLGMEGETLTVPASALIHDRMITLFHPLCGVSPIYACGMSATLGNTIRRNSAKFFENSSRPSGMLSAPGEISQSTADRLKKYWEENYSGENIGRLAVLGDGLKYEAMTIPAVDAQLIDQLRWSVEDVARAYHYPMYKLGGPLPTYNNIEALNQSYYSDCLQILIESLEMLLREGFSLPQDQMVQFDLDNLLRMDSATRYERHNKAIAGGWLKPNEARVNENYEPVEGGDSPMMQQQNYSLSALAERDRKSSDGSTDVQATAMNGAQVSALQGLIVAVSAGEIPKETARAAISAAFPLLSADKIDAMIDPIEEGSTPPTEPTEPPATPTPAGDEERDLTPAMIASMLINELKLQEDQHHG